MPAAAGSDAVHAARQRRARLTNWASCSRRRPDRHPGHPPRPKPGRPNTDECSGRLDRRASRCAWWHVGRRAAGPSERVGRFAAPAAPGGLARRPRRCAPECTRGSLRAGVPPQSPHQPPSLSEGDWWGDLHAVGREAGSPLRLLKARRQHHPSPTPSREGRGHPHPPPAPGRERGVQAKGSALVFLLAGRLSLIDFLCERGCHVREVRLV